MNVRPQHNILKYHIVNSGINRFILTHSLREFALAFISVFLPFFLLDKGYSLNLVILFYIIFFWFCNFFILSFFIFSI